MHRSKLLKLMKVYTSNTFSASHKILHNDFSRDFEITAIEQEDDYLSAVSLINTKDINGDDWRDSNFDRNEPTKLTNVGFNTNGVILTNLVIMASGATHIELGEHMLCSEYFANNSLFMNDDLKNWETKYYDFLVAYSRMFNIKNVGSWGIDNLANNVNLDFLYAEQWPDMGNKTYGDMIKKIMDINNKSSWQRVVIPAYMHKDATGSSSTEVMGFDGLHIDTLGPNYGNTYTFGGISYGNEKAAEDMPSFINDASSFLNTDSWKKQGSNIRMSFNNHTSGDGITKEMLLFNDGYKSVDGDLSAVTETLSGGDGKWARYSLMQANPGNSAFKNMLFGSAQKALYDCYERPEHLIRTNLTGEDSQAGTAADYWKDLARRQIRADVLREYINLGKKSGIKNMLYVPWGNTREQYYAKVTVITNSGEGNPQYVAINVDSSGKNIPIMGFLSLYGEYNPNNEKKVINDLKRHHINYIQYQSLIDLNTDKAIYNPYERVEFEGYVSSNLGKIKVEYYRREVLIDTQTIPFMAGIVNWSWYLPSADKQGLPGQAYGVLEVVKNDTDVLQRYTQTNTDTPFTWQRLKNNNIGGWSNWISVTTANTLSSQEINNETDWTPAPEDKADDSRVVHTIGNETIHDNKVFDGSVMFKGDIKPVDLGNYHVDGITNAGTYKSYGNIIGAWSKPKVGDSFHGRVSETIDFTGIKLDSANSSTPNVLGQGVYFQGVTGTNVAVSNIKFEIGATAYILNSKATYTTGAGNFPTSVPISFFSNKTVTLSAQVDYDNVTAVSGNGRVGVEFVMKNSDTQKNA
ncbi:hypothetical protein H7R52_07070 [Weissella confusa]|uniref:Uncharacterized protein n=1 Tax=Weissella confusa TaxID=1583 RepID=A0A923NGW0_WEICO|nr:hypothetical protein [Weissella confusa]